MIFIGSILGLSVESLAGGLSAPFRLQTARVLPAGVRSLSVGAITSMVDDWHNNNGNVVSVAEPMIQNLSYRRLLRSEPNLELRKNIQASLVASGVDLDSTAGVSLADVNTRVAVTLPSLAVGVTNWWTMGIAVPILYTNIDVETSFAGTRQLQGIINNLAKTSRSQTQIVEQKLTDVIATELEGKNYQPLEDREQTEVGDVSLVSKMNFYNGLNVRWAVVKRLTAPTARTRAINRMVDPAPGDGQWDFAITNVLEFPVSGKISLLHQIGHQVQFADHQDARLPFSSGERLSADIDENAYRDLGDISHTQFGATYSPFDAFSFGVAYYAGYKQRDQWRGGLGPQYRYDLLGIETEQFMQAALVQVGVSTVREYQRGQFPIPMMAQINYSNVFDGRNVRNAPVWSLNVSLFF